MTKLRVLFHTIKSFGLPKINMANSSTEISIKADHNNLLLILLIAIVAFSAGFVIARARYKPQLRETFNMVMEREDKIDELQSKVQEIENQMKMTNEKKTKL